jgi:hypothetical protein
MENILLGAISGNYSIDDINRWVETSDNFNAHRVLFLYNDENESLKKYLLSKNINVIIPEYDAYNRQVAKFETNTGNSTVSSSYDLVHNIRFYHIWQFLSQALADNDIKKVLITDVRDVFFNTNPFEKIPFDKIIASSEIVKYEQEKWNERHLYNNLTMIGYETLISNEIYNVGVFGGNPNIVKNICADIYLMSIGKPLVADQTSFNYLIHTAYKEKTIFTNLNDRFAVHLHVIANGIIPFDLKSIPEYSIVHQYDRL